jgi:NTP pyrophosphatase (non-canonical NTP hydrolase)
MNANEYQKLAARTLIDCPDFELTGQETMVIWDAIGLAGEAGEVADLVKKGIFHQHGLDTEKLQKEIGDVLWYAAALCTTLGFDLSKIMEANIEKLKSRYPNGYSSTDSIKRVDCEKP